MAKKKESSNFTSLMDEPTVNSVEDEKQENAELLEKYVDSIAGTVDDNAKVTNRLADKVEKMYKVFNSKKLYLQILFLINLNSLLINSINVEGKTFIYPLST